MKRSYKEIDQSVKEVKEEKYRDQGKAQKWVVIIGIAVIVAVLVITTLKAPTWVGSLEAVPPFRKDAFVVIDRNVPGFSQEQLVTTPYLEAAPLDELGRPGAVTACIGPETVPAAALPIPEELLPPGWEGADPAVFARTELIGSQLTGLEATAENLCTATLMQQTDGLRKLELQVGRAMLRDQVHVILRVTPVYEGDERIPRGFTLEAMSVEDQGNAVLLHLYVYNAQPGVDIDYR